MTEPMKWPESFQKALADRVAKERPWSSRNWDQVWTEYERDEFAKAAMGCYAVDETEALNYTDNLISAVLKEDRK